MASRSREGILPLHSGEISPGVLSPALEPWKDMGLLEWVQRRTTKMI